MAFSQMIKNQYEDIVFEFATKIQKPMNYKIKIL